VTKQIVETRGALVLASLTGLSGVGTLWYGTDVITTSLGFSNIVLYSFIYTYMKPISVYNTWVGAVVGAIPPVMGYAAATHGMGLFTDWEPYILGTTLFLWQFPHFFALSWMHRVDYKRGGFQMIATNDTVNGDMTSKLINRYTYFLSTVPILSTFVLDVTSFMFAVEGLVLNGYAIYVAKQFEKERTNSNAKRVFLTSLWYLPCWMVLFLIHSKKWMDDDSAHDENTSNAITTATNVDHSMVSTVDNDDDENYIIKELKQKAAEIRQKGRELCLHEIFIIRDHHQQQVDKVQQDQNSEAVSTYHLMNDIKDDATTYNDVNSSSSSQKCPVILGKQTMMKKHVPENETDN
jgi:protoheme IX farnesyltransferase